MNPTNKQIAETALGQVESLKLIIELKNQIISQLLKEKEGNAKKVKRAYDSGYGKGYADGRSYDPEENEGYGG